MVLWSIDSHAHLQHLPGGSLYLALLKNVLGLCATKSMAFALPQVPSTLTEAAGTDIHLSNPFPLTLLEHKMLLRTLTPGKQAGEGGLSEATHPLPKADEAHVAETAAFASRLCQCKGAAF